MRSTAICAQRAIEFFPLNRRSDRNDTSSDPAGITRGLAAIIHGGKSADEALEIAGQLVAS